MKGDRRIALFVVALLAGCGADSGPSRSETSTPSPGDSRAAGSFDAPEADESAGLASLIVHYHERVPYMYRSGDQVRGLTADRLALVFEEAGIPFEWRETPPRRQIEILEVGRGRDVLLGWFRNPEREKFAQFSLAIYRDRPTVALVRAGKLDPSAPPPVEAVLKHSALKLLVRDGYSYGSFLDEHIGRMGDNRLVTTVDNLAMARMIEAGRADYFFIAEEEAQVVVRESGVAPGELVEIHFEDMPVGNERHILFGRNIEREILERVDEAIRRKIDLSAGAG